MALFGPKHTSPPSLPAIWPSTPNVRLGALDCVGEAAHSSSIYSLLGAEQVLHCIAVLLPEPENPHDAEAIAVFVNGLRVGYLSRSSIGANSKAVLKCVAKIGYASVPAAILGGDFPQVVLQPGPLSRVRITEILLNSGFQRKDGDKGWGFTIREELNQTLIFCSGASAKQKADLVPKYAAALQAAGLRARVATDDGFVVHVT